MSQSQVVYNINCQDRLHAVPMEKLSLKERVQSFSEVALGYTVEQALQEAQRCLSCPNPQCIKGCPVGIEIPAFIKLIKEKKYTEAIEKIKEKNSLPAICGRVCPQEEQCQKFCIKGKKGDPVSIGKLERFVADLERENSARRPFCVPLKVPFTNRRVAIIGAGPAGLTAAAELGKTWTQSNNI